MANEITQEFKDMAKQAFYDINRKAVKAFQIQELYSIDDLIADNMGIYFVSSSGKSYELRYNDILHFLNTREHSPENIYGAIKKLLSMQKQYKIYKLNTFDLFTKEENELYNKHKTNKTLSEFNKKLKENKNIRVVNKNAFCMDNEIALFDSDLLRIIRGENSARNTPIKELIYIDVYHNEILEQITKDGFNDIDGNHYEIFTATSGQVREQSCTFINSDVNKKNEDAITNGMTEERINKSIHNGINTGKYLAHKGLIMTSSIPVMIDIDKVIVVDDFETIVTEKVEYIDTKTLKPKIKEMSILVNHCDGAGMVLPDVLNKSCQLRGRWIKGALFPFDFKKFALEVAENTKVLDIYKKEHDIIEEDIWVILTKSQFKMWKYYDSWDEYKKYFQENNLRLSVLNESKEHPEQKEAAYQFLQTLNRDLLTDEKIKELCDNTVNKIKSLYEDPEEMKKILGATEDNKELKPLQEALIIYPGLLYDNHIKTQIQKTVRSYRRNAMAGKILLDGFYSYICPDLYAMCEKIFQGIEIPQGLVPKGMVYNGFYNERNETKCDLLRSPHLYNEHCVREFIKDESCKNWFIGHDTIVSTHDLTQRTLMCDVDGDECMLVTSDAIFDLITPCLPLYYDMFPAAAQEINKKNIYDTLILGFCNNKVGEISNVITKLWNTDNAEIDLEFIKILQMYNNFSIDYPKTGKNIELTVELKDKYNELIEGKTPYFFQYAKDKKSKNCEPLNNSVVNRISKYIKGKTNNLHYKPFKDKTIIFNEAMLQKHEDNFAVNRSSDNYNKLQQALTIWEKKIGSLSSKFNQEKKNNEEFKTKFDIHYQYCKDELMKIYNDDINSLVNAFVDIEYLQPYNQDKPQRNILWNCFGDIILQNIKENLSSDIEIKSKTRLAYLKEDKEQYNKIKPRMLELVTPKYVCITKQDIKNINELKSNDRLIFYVITCLCKAFDNKLIISKRKKTKVNNKSGKKPKFILNANTIDKLAGTTTFGKAIVRLKENSLLNVTDDKNKLTISLVNLYGDNTAFVVENIWNPLLYLGKYEGKPTAFCKIDGKEFIKDKNKKTCCDACSKILAKRTKKTNNEKTKLCIDIVSNM